MATKTTKTTTKVITLANEAEAKVVEEENFHRLVEYKINNKIWRKGKGWIKK